MKIAIVGPCAAGKTTLARKLRAVGYDAHDIAQEHSLVRTMWSQITQPDMVIYLDVSVETVRRRRDVDWEREYVAELAARCADARAHADMTLDTNELSADQVAEHVLKFLSERNNA